MRMLEIAPAAVLREVLFFYRANPDSLTSDPIRYLEGMARSHDAWRRRIRDRLSAGEQHVYRDKVAAFLHAVAWEQSLRGRPAAAVSASLRALRVRRRVNDWLAVPRSLVRALCRRVRSAAAPASTVQSD
jgi:hypothetical protein